MRKKLKRTKLKSPEIYKNKIRDTIQGKISSNESLTNVELCWYFKFSCEKERYFFSLRDLPRYVEKIKRLTSTFEIQGELYSDDTCIDPFTSEEVIKIIDYYVQNCESLHKKFGIDSDSPTIHVMVGYVNNFASAAIAGEKSKWEDEEDENPITWE